MCLLPFGNSETPFLGAKVRLFGSVARIFASACILHEYAIARDKSISLFRIEG
jgi:hypothetical protein